MACDIELTLSSLNLKRSRFVRSNLRSRSSSAIFRMMLLIYFGHSDFSDMLVLKSDSSVRRKVSQASTIPPMLSMNTCVVSITSLMVLVFVLLLSSSKTRRIVCAFKCL